MARILSRENDLYGAVENGELEIDSDGRVWRLGARRGDRWTGGTRFHPGERRRAENSAGVTGYLQVRVMLNGKRVHALAHRLVYRHFFGPIPEGMVINHRNGDKKDNRPSNLEIATYSENAVHSLRVLRRGRIDQNGARNAMAKLTAEQVREIRARREAGESQASIARDYGIKHQAVSKIVRRDRWAALAG